MQQKCLMAAAGYPQWLVAQGKARRICEPLADQKITIAGQEMDRNTRVGHPAQVRGDRCRERIGQLIVTYPVLEQVAEDAQAADAVCDAIIDKRGEPLRDDRVLRMQVQIGDQSGRRGKRQHVSLSGNGQSFSARSMTTSSTGTFWWKPLLPVRTSLMRSMTSRPSTTCPNTQ